MAVRIGELLLKEKRITPEQLQEALSYQRQNGGKLGANLVKLGFVKDEEITSLLSKQYGVPSISLNQFEIDPAVIKLVLKYLGRDPESPSEADFNDVEATLLAIRPLVRTIDTGTILDTMSTLLNPGVDPGPTHIHGLTTTVLAGAPQFHHISTPLTALLHGRTLVLLRSAREEDVAALRSLHGRRAVPSRGHGRRRAFRVGAFLRRHEGPGRGGVPCMVRGAAPGRRVRRAPRRSVRKRPDLGVSP